VNLEKARLNALNHLVNMATLQNNRRNQEKILEILVTYWNLSDLSQSDCEGCVPDIYRFLLSESGREELARHLYDKDIAASGAERSDSLRWMVAEKVADRLLSLRITA